MHSYISSLSSFHPPPSLVSRPSSLRFLFLFLVLFLFLFPFPSSSLTLPFFFLRFNSPIWSVPSSTIKQSNYQTNNQTAFYFPAQISPSPRSSSLDKTIKSCKPSPPPSFHPPSLSPSQKPGNHPSVGEDSYISFPSLLPAAGDYCCWLAFCSHASSERPCALACVTCVGMILVDRYLSPSPLRDV